MLQSSASPCSVGPRYKIGVVDFPCVPLSGSGKRETLATSSKARESAASKR